MAEVQGRDFIYFFRAQQMFGSAYNPCNLSKITYVRAVSLAMTGDRCLERLMASILWKTEEI